MSKARLVITAVVVEGRSQAETARAYGVSKGWVSKLIARYRTEGEAAFEPHSRRPRSSPTAIGPQVIELIVAVRKKLVEQGLDAGPETIAWHLQHTHHVTVSRATIARHLAAQGLVTPEPSKRPKSSYIRFQAEQPNECWQADFTHYRLRRPDSRPGADVEILSWLDDHSRYALSVTAHPRVTGPIVRDVFRETVATHGVPASTLTDNGMVFTTRLSGGSLRGSRGRNGLEHELHRLGVRQKNSRPNHPTTCGKVERFQQTLKKWLRSQSAQPATITALQTLIDAFVTEYNHRRPHRSLPRHATPATAYQTRPKAEPGSPTTTETHDRLRHDRIDKAGKITLRYNGQLYSIGVGRTHTGTHVLVLVQDLNIRIIDAATGELLRGLVLDPTRRYQPTGRPPGPAPKTKNP
ncbi:IS481 family transposase [Actinoplanes sp. NPDC049548]|uniref:IS481 family transposase n=1 Tax=Actinoplanes sp. NPDC049548 TaxID=3155152 RepID=UPI00343BC250